MIEWIKKFFADFKDGQRKYYHEISVMEEANKYRKGYVVVYLGGSGWDNPPVKEFTSKKRAFADARRASFRQPVHIFEVNLNDYDLDLGDDPHGRYGVKLGWSVSVKNPEKNHTAALKRKTNNEDDEFSTHFIVFHINHGKAYNTFFKKERDAHSFAKEIGWSIIARMDDENSNGDCISEFDNHFLDIHQERKYEKFEWWEYQNGKVIAHENP